MGIETMALALYDARQEKAAAKQAMRDYYAQHPRGCEWAWESRGEYEQDGRCYERTTVTSLNGHIAFPIEEWCETCKGSEPLYLRWKRAHIAATSAMRNLMAACKKVQR